MKQALLIIDMQCGMLDRENPPQGLAGVVDRINRVAAIMRELNRPVIFIQHEGPIGDKYAPGESGWQFLPELVRTESDFVVVKTICDAFYQTKLHQLLTQLQITELLITGWATDFCVDTTVRAAASHRYNITVISDAHTASNRSHLDAVSIIEHHNQTWLAMDVPGRQNRIIETSDVIAELLANAA